MLRRLLIATGAALFVFGWGLTRWADYRARNSQQEVWMWWSGEAHADLTVMPSDTMMEYGVLLMATGAGVSIFNLTRRRSKGEDKQ